ncbi:hypothetical protein GCM10027422_33680 [Hymenobacter arcticus]
MKKRLRKKLRLKEFETPQWWIRCKFHSGLSEDQVDEIKERFSTLANLQGFSVFRACDVSGCSFILDGSRRYKAPTEEQRQSFSKYLQALPEVISIEDKGLGYL